MIGLSTKEPVRWTPPWREGDATAPVYRLRAGSVIERSQLEAELAGEYRAGRTQEFEWLAAFEEGVNALLAGDPDGAARLVELARADGTDDLTDPVEKGLLAEARETLAENWPAYRALVAREQRRQEMAPLVAFRRFCVGWDGEDMPAFVKSPDHQVSLDVMAKLSPLDIKVAGITVYGMLYGGTESPNSEAPSPSDEGPQSSTSDIAPAVGSSAASDGPKTRSSRSRPGRSR